MAAVTATVQVAMLLFLVMALAAGYCSFNKRKKEKTKTCAKSRQIHDKRERGVATGPDADGRGPHKG